MYIFLCHLQIMVVTYGSCLGHHRRLLSCPRCNTFGFRSVAFEGIHQFHSMHLLLLQIMVVTYGSCLGHHRRLLSCPRCNTFGLRSITFEGIHQFHSMHLLLQSRLKAFCGSAISSKTGNYKTKKMIGPGLYPKRFHQAKIFVQFQPQMDQRLEEFKQ